MASSDEDPASNAAQLERVPVGAEPRGPTSGPKAGEATSYSYGPYVADSPHFSNTAVAYQRFRVRERERERVASEQAVRLECLRLAFERAPAGVDRMVLARQLADFVLGDSSSRVRASSSASAAVHAET